MTAKGPVGKFFSEESIKEIMKICSANIGDSIFLSCGSERELENFGYFKKQNSRGFRINK